MKNANIKKTIVSVILLFISMICFSQNIEKYDQIIDMKYYKSYYSNNIQGPSFVIYKLYKGGGNVSRNNMKFKEYNKLPHFNYLHSCFDRGHLVPAEDFANSKAKLESTFYYINCVPQTVTLNRGIWKKYETEIRKFSQLDSLLIICGGCDYDFKNKFIPRNCFKIVYSLKTKQCIYSLLFYNDGSDYVKVEDKLQTKITYKKAIELYEKRNTKESYR